MKVSILLKLRFSYSHSHVTVAVGGNLRIGGEKMTTSRRQSKAIEMRSVFSSTGHHAYVVHIQEMSYVSHARFGFLPVVCRHCSRVFSTFLLSYIHGVDFCV